MQRLAAHALANLSVNCMFSKTPRQLCPSRARCARRGCDGPLLTGVPLTHATAENQRRMAEHGAADMLIDLLNSTHEPVQRQAAKALANLGVSGPLLPPCLAGARG